MRRLKGINEFPRENIPPLFLTFVSYHNMVILGMYFILILSIAAFKIYRKTLWESKKLLKILFWSIPLPLAACQLGWIATEVGRQPWIVYHLMRTKDAVSVSVGAGEILFSIFLFGAIYILLFSVLFVLLKKKVNKGFDLLSEEGI